MLTHFSHGVSQPTAADLHGIRFPASAGKFTGCIGNLDAHQPLVNEVAENAFNAAFRDPRFSLVEHAELAGLPVDYWSPTLPVYRYETIILKEQDQEKQR